MCPGNRDPLVQVNPMGWNSAGGGTGLGRTGEECVEWGIEGTGKEDRLHSGRGVWQCML